jgi:hypothetical protein
VVEPVLYRTLGEVGPRRVLRGRGVRVHARSPREPDRRVPGNPSRTRARSRSGGGPSTPRSTSSTPAEGLADLEDLRPLLRPRERGRARHRPAHPARERVPPPVLPGRAAARRPGGAGGPPPCVS